MKRKRCIINLNGRKYEAPEWLVKMAMIMIPIVIVIIGYIIIQIIGELGAGLVAILGYKGVRDKIDSWWSNRQLPN